MKTNEKKGKLSPVVVSLAQYNKIQDWISKFILDSCSSKSSLIRDYSMLEEDWQVSTMHSGSLRHDFFPSSRSEMEDMLGKGLYNLLKKSNINKNLFPCHHTRKFYYHLFFLSFLLRKIQIKCIYAFGTKQITKNIIRGQNTLIK